MDRIPAAVFDKRICSDLTVLTETGLGATAPTTETGEAGNRLSAIGAAPFSVLASKLADGKDTPRQPCGFPGPAGHENPPAAGHKSPTEQGLRNVWTLCSSNHPWGTFMKAR